MVWSLKVTDRRDEYGTAVVVDDMSVCGVGCEDDDFARVDEGIVIAVHTVRDGKTGTLKITIVFIAFAECFDSTKCFSKNLTYHRQQWYVLLHRYRPAYRYKKGVTHYNSNIIHLHL